MPRIVTRCRRASRAHRIRRWAPLLLLAGLAVAAPGALGAQVEDREAELEEIRGEIAVLQARLGRLTDRQSGIADLLARTELQVELQEKRVEEVRLQRRLAQAASQATEGRIQELEARLEESRESLRDRLIDLYRLGRHGSLRLLFSIQSRRHIVTGIRMLRYLARREAGQIDEFVGARVRLAFERDQLREQQRHVEELLRGVDRRLASLEQLRRRQSALLAEVESEQAVVSERATRLMDKERKLSHLLDFLSGRGAGISGTPLREFKGALDWPIRGRVTGAFGPRLDSRYRTRVPHNGIDLETPPGAEVRAIYPGRVLFAAPFEGFGLTVVVSHPGRALTLYAGLAELRVATDDVLSLGQAVGVAGRELYFEIRVDNRPQDPLGWLR